MLLNQIYFCARCQHKFLAYPNNYLLNTKWNVLNLDRHLSNIGKHASVSAVRKEESVKLESTDLLKDFVKQFWDSSIAPDHPKVVELSDGLIRGSRAALARCITLVESRHPTNRAIGDQVLVKILARQQAILKSKGPSSLIFRIGISGSPGVGKSSFLETFGLYLVNECGLKIAILTVDPSSQSTGGSLLGDITRMPDLARHPSAYIRASPTRGTLGGVTFGTREAILLCEGAGYDVVLIETVGVGQSEVAVSEIADMLVLLLSPNQGDEVQGLKRGIMELCDLLLVTKSDGNLVPQARMAQAEYLSALKFMRSRWGNIWKPKVIRTSAHTGEGIPESWTAMQAYWTTLADSGRLLRMREDQFSRWMWLAVEHKLPKIFRQHPDVQKLVQKVEPQVFHGELTPDQAAEKMLRKFLNI